MMVFNRAHYRFTYSTSLLVSPSSSDLPLTRPEHLKMIPARNPLSSSSTKGYSTSFKAASLESFVSMLDKFVNSNSRFMSDSRMSSSSEVVRCENVPDTSPFASSHKDSISSKSSLENSSRIPMFETITVKTFNIDSDSFDDDDHVALSELLRPSRQFFAVRSLLVPDPSVPCCLVCCLLMLRLWMLMMMIFYVMLLFL